MPLKDPEKRREYERKRREKNKEQVAEYMRNYNEKNKEKIKEYQKEYYENNKKEIYEKNKKGWYEKNKETEKYKKSQRIAKWKHRGVKSDNYDNLYELYLSQTNCEECNCVLGGTGSTRKVLDHNHQSGEFRNILCMSCNVKRQ